MQKLVLTVKLAAQMASPTSYTGLHKAAQGSSLGRPSPPPVPGLGKLKAGKRTWLVQAKHLTVGL